MGQLTTQVRATQTRLQRRELQDDLASRVRAWKNPIYAVWEKILLLITMGADTPAHEELLKSLLQEAQEKMDAAWKTSERRKTETDKGSNAKAADEDKGKQKGRLAYLECFLCTQKGHLASFCPQRNMPSPQDKGEPKKE